jgi:hypothetical protein
MKPHLRLVHDGLHEVAAWNVLVALQRHGLDNPTLLENPDYQAAIKRAHDEWAEVFQG